jgi:hypothetical protein
VRWRLLVWLAVAFALAAAAALGADVVVVGPDKAAALAGVIAGFCELGALVLGVVGWMGERRVAGDRSGSGVAYVGGKGREGPVADARVSEGMYVVDSRHARGVQVGDHNFQRNAFGRAAAGDEDGVEG